MSYANGTLHYNLPQTVGTDTRDWSDTNQAFEDIDTALYGAVSDVATASSKVDALDVQINTPSTGIASELSDAQADIISIGGRVSTLEGTVSAHTNQIADVRADAEDMISAFNESTSTSTHNYSIGDKFIYNDTLYIATASINIGDTITPNTNCSTTNVTSLIDGLTIPTTASGISYDNTTSGLTADDVQEAIDEVNANLTDKQNKAWQLYTNNLTSALMDLPSITYNEMFLAVKVSDWYVTMILPVDVIPTDSTTTNFKFQCSVDTDISVLVGNGKMKINTFIVGGTDYLASANGIVRIR